jgi:hypothetical protein
MLLSPRLQKLLVDSLVVLHKIVFHKTRPLVKRNNTEFTNVSNFTSLPMCSTHFTLSCRILLFSLPTSNNFFQVVYSEISWESAWQVLFRPLGVVCLSGYWGSSELDLILFWTSDIQDLPALCRELLYSYFTFLFVFSVLYTKNALKCTV